MKFPGGILINTATGRFHPIIFRCGTPPSGPLEGGVDRYKSKGHHTDGFDTLEEAQALFKEGGGLYSDPYYGGWYDTGVVYGVDIPAIVAWFGPQPETK